MADYPQPPYGFPPPPPPHLVHQQHQQQHGGHAFMPQPPHAPQDHHPTFAGAFPGGIPGLNMSAYAQNLQQPPFPQWPPAPPIPQTNTYGLPFPPPLPQPNGSGFSIPPPPPPPLHGFAPPPHALPSRPVPSQAPSAPSRVPASDREEGEVSDGEAASMAPRGAGRANASPSSGMANRAGVPRNDSRNSHRQNNPRQTQPAPGSRYPAIQPAREAAPASQSTRGLQPVEDRFSQPNMPPNAQSPFVWKRSAVKNFVKTLHENNVGYPALAREGLDTKMLRSVYDELGLPVPVLVEAKPAPTPKPATVTTAPPPAAAPAQAPAAKTDAPVPSAKPVPVVATSALQTAAAKPVSSPVDRKDYIARLQAMKSSKLGATNPTSQEPALLAGVPTAVASLPSAPTPQSNAPVPAPVPATRSEPSVPAAMPKEAPVAKDPISVLEAERKTAMIRERLARLRAQHPSATASPAPKPTSQPEPPLSSPFSKIPGLFMNADSTPTAADLPAKPPLTAHTGTVSSAPATALPGLRAQSPVAVQPVNKFAGRKRPVASDFDDVSTPTSLGPAYTRPLGQSPHEHDSESMIIEVSDDESEGSDMDLDDSQADALPVAKSSPAGALRNGAPNLWSSMASSGLPPRPGSSAFNTPSGGRTPAGAVPTKEYLEETDKNIQLMKLKIAEMEKKKRAEMEQKSKAAAAKKEAVIRATDIGANSVPQSLNAQSTPAPSSLAAKPAGRTASHVAAPLPQSVGVPVDVTGDTSQSRKRRAVEAQAAVRALDHEYKLRTARLAQIQKEMEDLVKWENQYKLDKEKLQKELEEYGVDTEGMTRQELQAEKDRIVSQNETGDSRSTIPSVALVGHAQAADSAENGSSKDAATAVEAADREHAPGVMEASSNALEPSVATSIAASLPTTQESPSATATTAPVKPTLAEERPTETSIPVQDGEDFYSPQPANSAVLEQPGAVASEEPARRPSAISEEGEMAMSESSTEDEEAEYVPEEAVAPHTTSPPPAVQVAPDSIMADARSRASSPSATSMSTTEDEEDDDEVYEPPEPGEMSPAVNFSDEVSGAQPVEGDQTTDMDVSMSDSDETTSDESRRSPSPDTHSAPASPNRPSGSVTIISDDLAPELQPSVPPAAAASSEVAKSERETPVDNRTRYTPYQSPLRFFKSYRYHPAYPQDVAGGFLSQTYSHQIDATKPLCRFECGGGTCNDEHCGDQHWRDMEISPDKLLVQLGTANPGKTPEEQQRYIDGLRQVLRDIRSKNIDKDPAGIALEITKYRRQFLNDDTRVINLEPARPLRS